MPSYTSVKSGYWSDPTTWTPVGVPKEGDTVTIAAGHTVILDTDLSGFPNGLAGLTINGTLLIPSLNDPNYGEVGEETSGTPWLSGWSYRRTVFVDNSFSSTALTDFQITIRLNTAFLIFKGKMRSDCGDIRVTDSNGNLLPVWIDPDTKGLWNTKVYVKVPSIPANSVVTLYLFYGNPDATDVSDPASVFDFFDDFSGTTLDETKWTAARWTGTGAWSVTVGNGYVEINSGSSTRAGIVSKTAFALPFIVEGKLAYVSGDQLWNSITQTASGSHSDLVEHGYDSSGARYTYRKASGGSYTNYQQFSRNAPRSWFTRFAIEWLTDASRYHEWDIQVNSTTTQDRYTSGSCYIQLSTFNGTARWDWIAVRKHAATLPAVYFRTMTWIALKVNANIAGTGTLQIGSESYPIVHPQKAQIFVNGTIQPAYFRVYGETRRTWDWLAVDAPTTNPTVTLRNGIPLRKGDVLLIYSNEPMPVLDYNPETKTVTIPRPPLQRTGERLDFPMTTLLLMTYTVDLLKFGGNNVYYAAGTDFIFVGTFFTRLPLFVPTASGMGANLTNPTFRYCGNYRMTANDYDGHWIKGGGGVGYWQWCAVEAGTSAWGWAGNGWSSSSTSTIEDCCMHNPRYGLSFQGLNTWRRCYQQGGSSGFGFVGLAPGSVFDSCVLIGSGGNSFDFITIKNCRLINSSGLGGSYNYYENITFYNDNADRSYLGGTRNVFRNIELHLNSTHRNVLLNGARQCCIHNVVVYSYANAPFLSISNDVWSDNIIEGLTVNGTCHVRLMGDPSSDSNVSYGMQMLGRFANVSVPILSGNYGNIPGGGIVYHPAGYWNIEQLTVGSLYNRATVHNTKSDVRFNRLVRLVSSVRIKGLTVGTVPYPEALEFIGFHGWAKNRWDSSPPDYQTFDFYLNPTVTGYYGTNNVGPILAWWVFQGSSPIQISGAITQLGSNESVGIEIFRYPKEPLLGDTPEFQQVLTQAGSFMLSWTPPDVGIWVTRIRADLYQTSNPITIANLQVMSFGGGGGGGGGSVNIEVQDQINVSAAETVTNQLAIQQSLNAVISGVEQVNPNILVTVGEISPLQSADAVVAQISLLGNDLVQVSANESVQPSLQMSVSDISQVSAQDSAIAQVLAFQSENIPILAAEIITPSVAVTASDVTQVQTSESPMTQIAANSVEIAQLLATEQIAPILGLTVVQNEQVITNESVNMFSGIQFMVDDSIQVTTSESYVANFAANIAQQELIQTTESPFIQVGISILEEIKTTAVESVAPTVLPQVSETLRVSASEQPTVSLQVTAQTQTEVRSTESVSSAVQVFAADEEAVSIAEASSVSIAGSISEVVRVSTTEGTVTQVQLSAVESVTQVEAETAPFVGLIQRLMIPVSIDVLRSVELNISITYVSLSAGID